MSYIRFSLVLFLILSSILYAQRDDSETIDVKDKNITKPIPLKQELIPLTKTTFKIINNKTKKEQIVDLTNQNFILVSVREHGSDGRFYAVDVDGTVWWSGPVTSGADEYRSPSGVFPIIQKKRYHMSTAYPDENGINNMDYMMKFTRFGHALHLGSVDWMSHGCIHIDKKDVPTLFKWSTFDTKVVITRHSYMPFAKDDLKKIYSHW